MPPSPSPLPPPTLPYDDLPPGSDIRREQRGDGSVHVVVPAAEPPPAVMKQTLYAALVAGARSSWAMLLLAAVVFLYGLRINQIAGVVLVYAWAFFGIFCGALVLLVAWVRFGVMRDALRAGRRQTSVLHATPTRLLIETAGPFGVASYDLPADAIVDLTIARGALRDDLAQNRRVTHLAVRLRDGRTILLLPSRDQRELKWIRAALRRTLALP